MATVVPSTDTATYPAGQTCANLIRYVMDYVQVADDPVQREVARREIDRAIDRLNSVKWQKVLGSQVIYTVLDRADYPVNSDFKEPLHCELLNLNSQPTSRLFYMPWKLFVDQYPEATNSGTPRHYTFDFATRMFQLNRPADQGFVTNYPYIRLRYHRRVAHCSTDSTVPGAPPEFDRFIGWDARSAYARLRGRPADADRAAQEAERAWRELRVDDIDSDTDWPDA